MYLHILNLFLNNQDESDKDLDLNRSDKEEIDQSDSDDKEEIIENIENKSNEFKYDEYFENEKSVPKINNKDSYLNEYLC